MVVNGYIDYVLLTINEQPLILSPFIDNRWFSVEVIAYVSCANHQ